MRATAPAIQWFHVINPAECRARNQCPGDRLTRQAANGGRVIDRGPIPKLKEQLTGWVAREGCRWVKMKVGSTSADDLARVEAARAAIGDVLPADATRCGGYTGFLKAAALADPFGLPLSAHTAPALHLPVCCAAPRLRNIEWFHDHARIERLVFDGAPLPRGGVIRPDLTQAGHGLTFKQKDAERLAA
jgi:L-alanine-DL-glutamate epimerase-like enolase superfamily enzyme